MSGRIWAQLVHLGMNIGTRADAEKHEVLGCDDGEWRIVTDRMAANRLNMIVIDLLEGVRYPSHPEIGAKGAWSVEKLRSELKRLRAMGLEPIPKMNFSACHDEWLGDYGRMLSTSDYYRVCEDLIRDCCEIFDHPRYFHFGYDEEDIRCQSAFELTVVRQGELWWHDFLWFVKAIEKCGMRPWMWSDYAWEHHDEFLKRCPRSVLQSNWYYDEGFNERAFRWPRVKCYLDLDKAGFDQIPTGSNHLYDTNMAETVAFSEKNLSPVRLKGYMMSTWRRCLAEHRQRNLAAADQIGAARTKFER